MGISYVLGPTENKGTGSCYYAGDEIGNVSLIELRTQSILDTIQSCRGEEAITSIQSSPYSDVLFVTSNDGIGRLWNQFTCTMVKPVQRYFTRGAVGSALYLPEREAVYALYKEGNYATYTALLGHAWEFPGYTE